MYTLVFDAKNNGFKSDIGLAVIILPTMLYILLTSGYKMIKSQSKNFYKRSLSCISGTVRHDRL